MYKKYDSYRYQVMWNHPKLMVNDPEHFECYYETNFLEHAGQGRYRLRLRYQAERTGQEL